MYRLFFLFFVFLVACQSEGTSGLVSKGLQKLNDDEVVKRVKNNALYNQNIVFKDIYGNVITRDSLKFYNEHTFFADYYANAGGEVKEVILRKVKESDHQLIQRIKDAAKESQNAVSDF